MPRITAKLGLAVDELPDFTTVCTRKQDLEMRIWRVLLRSSASLHKSGEVQAIDSTSLAHRSSSHNYAKRVKDIFESVKTTLLVDCNSGAILDVHCSMNLPHDTQIAWQVLTRNLDQLETVVADKGFDWDDIRHKLREEGIRPVIKHVSSTRSMQHITRGLTMTSTTGGQSSKQYSSHFANGSAQQPGLGRGLDSFERLS